MLRLHGLWAAAILEMVNAQIKPRLTRRAMVPASREVADEPHHQRHAPGSHPESPLLIIFSAALLLKFSWLQEPILRPPGPVSRRRLYRLHFYASLDIGVSHDVPVAEEQSVAQAGMDRVKTPGNPRRITATF